MRVYSVYPLSETHISSGLRQSSGGTWNSVLWWVLEQPVHNFLQLHYNYAVQLTLNPRDWSNTASKQSIADTTWCQINYVYLPVFTGAPGFFILFYEGKSIFHCRALMKIHEIMYKSVYICFHWNQYCTPTLNLLFYFALNVIVWRFTTQFI